jgi:hypothetical protein
MLRRSPRVRSPEAVKKAAYRARQARGVMVVSVEIDADIVSMLVRLRWLPARELHGRAEISRALQAMIADAAAAK